MPSGLIPEHYGAPRHFSLPTINNKPKERLVAGSCDRLNLFYLRDSRQKPGARYTDALAYMRYRRVKKDVVRLDGMHVSESLRGRGISNVLAREVLNHMTDRNIWVDVRCPITREYVRSNQYPQYVRQLVNPGILQRRQRTNGSSPRVPETKLSRSQSILKP